ncbi:chromosome segregation protein SMC [Clostridium tetani]|uniref:Chromosome partition protein Smc n=1 Tax=Clostridium tetani TaxID=1513 RepID=A0ABY0ENI9_CLOTA|nr:chromosome segregation protein SMC [Clostridium tetani]CDI49338.1 chromosome segregation protein smc2 [Clostridium tetani 12124569]KHO39340.1 chromosome segregation protein SMC [Clostridium tetani]RXI37807.1 chromosome segregation protein SMC [Clostridium tetani]RXI51804.1 chromosome segregation protein SMC [Clostridium tetani]RXI73971.1 chromosome segregation protein SMC [Clostridium tetani]
MFLKSLEIRGFKSFANKTEINFQKGITAIVGPNGSGKSNISDAIRWVLGEQSIKNLRGGKMEDVIFAGTQFRKPVGLAKVSLTLDNSKSELPLDYSEIMVSRIIYRSGESEYLINNNKCRLKDIQELFMDTGIGKEGYSIIGQGKIDAILSGKPEERRSLLEEAAGIVKFKKRKEEAERKLEKTEENIIRIQDITSTYMERLGPLEKESKKAKEFLNLSNNLKEKEINIILYSIEELNSKVGQLDGKIKEVQGEISNLELKKNDYKENLKKLGLQIDNLEERIQDNKKGYYNKKEEHSNLKNEIYILKERIDNLNKFIENVSDEIKKDNIKLEEICKFKKIGEERFSKNKKLLEELLVDFTEKEGHIENLNKEFKNKDLELKKCKEDHIQYLSEISNLKNKMSLVENNIKSIKDKLINLKENYESCMNSIKINITTLEALKDKVEVRNITKENHQNKIKENKKEISKINSILNRKNKEVKDLNINFNKLMGNYQFLSNLEREYEGYNKSVKNLMKAIQRGHIKNALNNSFVVGEVINVKKEYELCMEIALGGAISNIITRDENIAKELINYLKINKLGRATFLPLNIIKGNSIELSKDIKNTSGYIGIACELINYKEEFSQIIKHILGRTIICEDMDKALNIAKKLNYRYKIVTLAGEIINAGGALTGGSVYQGKNSNVIGRKREIKELQREIKEIENKIKLETDVIEKDKNKLSFLEESCLNLKDEIYFEDIEITKLTEKLYSIENENLKLKDRMKILKNEKENLNGELEGYGKDEEENKGNLLYLEKTQNDNEKKIHILENELKDKEESLNKLKEGLTLKRIEKAQIEEVISNDLKELERTDTDVENLKNSLAGKYERLKASKVKLQEYIENLDLKKGLTEEMEKNLTLIEETFKEEEIQLLKLKEDKNKIQGEEENIIDIKGKKEEVFHKYDISMTKLQTQRENLYNKIMEYEVNSYEEALEYKKPIDNLNDYRNYIKNIKAEINKLGTVNVGAIQEYEDTREKYDFMSSQKEDLINAKDEITQLIDEMTNKMKIIFKENFQKLRKNFDETFKELFKGGTADLLLSSEDELNGAIDITVQPPGKKLQNINLMSGGEKVLSAIALLFAILKMKPTPFCILDEIEAALDDANVVRYAEFLKSFSNNIQFIIITHRKGSMEVSNALYGVTMEEKGVSKVVSVDLKN